MVACAPVEKVNVSCCVLSGPLLLLYSYCPGHFLGLVTISCRLQFIYSPTCPAVQSQSSCDVYLLHTYSMVQSPSWEAKWFAASQEIPRISRNPKVHYRTHKGPPPVSILGQPNPVHIPTSHLLEIHPNISGVYYCEVISEPSSPATQSLYLLSYPVHLKVKFDCEITTY